MKESLGATPASNRSEGEPRKYRPKSVAEVAIEQRWRQTLLEGGSADDFQQAYDELHAEFLEHQSTDEDGIYADVNPRSAEDRVRAVILACVGSEKRVLEVGTGDGATSHALAVQGNSVLSMDVSRLALQRARARWARESGLDLRFEFGDARALGSSDGELDFVVSENMVEHISPDDMHAHLDEVRRVLAPGGAYLLYTPSRLWSGRASAGFHLHVYTLRELCALMRQHGFAPFWLEPRLLHRTGRLWKISGLPLWGAWFWEALLGALRVHRWPVSVKSRILPSIMVYGCREESL